MHHCYFGLCRCCVPPSHIARANATCFFGTICGAGGPITSLTPPYEITIEQLDGSGAAPVYAANIAKAIGSKSFKITTNGSSATNFRAVIARNKLSVSYSGLPGVVFHYKDVLTNEEITDQVLLATFLCACRYEKIIFARALANSTISQLYRATGENTRLIFFDAIIFSLGLLPAVNLISEILTSEEDPIHAWSMFVAVCGASSFKYGESYAWTVLLREWANNPPIPESAGAFAYNLGNALFNQGQWVAAVESFHSALIFDSNYKGRAYFWLEYGAANFEAGDFITAAKCYETALSLTDSSAPRWRLGDALFHSGQFEEAVKHFQRALQDAEERDKEHILLKILAGTELIERWRIKSQTFSAISEEDLNSITSITKPIDAQEVTSHLFPLLNKNALDPTLNFNAGVFASKYKQHSTAAYCFLRCALSERGDPEAWTNTIFCALNSNDAELAALSAKSAHFFLKEDFQPWILGLMENSPEIPKEMAETWHSAVAELVNELDRESDMQRESPVLRIHGEAGVTTELCIGDGSKT